MPGSTDRKSPAATETANDAFKKSASNWLAYGVIGAVAVHFALFALFPNLQAADLSGLDESIEMIELPPEVKIPPPPEQIARPATPKVAAADIADDVTIAPTTFDENPVENLPPPPKTGSPADRPSFIPYDVAPKLSRSRSARTSSALTLLAELSVLPEDMSARQWVAHAGIDPRHSESGTSVKGAVRISKVGNRHLRAALFLPAMVASQHEPRVRAYYEKLLARGKKPMQALVAVMRKLLHAIHGMFQHDADFDGTKFFAEKI